MLCVECSVVWCRGLDTTTEWEKTTGSIWDVGMEKGGECKMDIQNKKNAVVLESLWKGRIMLELIKKEEKKLAGTLAKKELPAEGCSRRDGKWEEGSRQENISDDRQHYDKWTVRRYENVGYKREEWKMLSLQRKTCPWAEHYGWLTINISWEKVHYISTILTLTT